MHPASKMHPASYRDPSGFIFIRDKEIYRQVNLCYKEQYDYFMSSGCYDHLSKNGWVIRHEGAGNEMAAAEGCYKVLKPEKINFITYPYEWGFDMLKEAALLTLTVLRGALKFDMILKDASPYNIQWQNGCFVFIDTLSFEKCSSQPWIAYRQFCENFLAPLLITRYSGVPSHQLQLAYPDGIPLEIVKKILPYRARFSFSVYLHIFLHSKFSNGNSDSQKKRPFGKNELIQLVANLEGLIKGLHIKKQASAWSSYYEEGIENPDYLNLKKEKIVEWMGKMQNKESILDIGCNTGEFSFIAAQHFNKVYSADFDPGCINELYLANKKSGTKNLQPFILDLANPSPANGFNSKERMSFVDRNPAGTILALAVIHHLVIGKSIPLENIHSFFYQMGNTFIIEFVSKNDKKVQGMLKEKNNVCHTYTEEHFVAVFSGGFVITDSYKIPGTERTLYFLRKKSETDKKS
jgi:SAM-dependent methyltransferase